MTSAPHSSRQSIFHPEFLEDLEHWVSTNPKTAKKILKLAKMSLRDPFKGEGKPEPLKHIGSNIWSRRITQSDRLVYLVEDKSIQFLQARFHYS